MKIALFVPRVHFYAPRVLTELIPDSDDRFLLLTTPKIGGASGGGSLIDWIRSKGLRYLFDQATLRGIYGGLNRWERWRTTNGPGQWYEVSDFTDYPHVEGYYSEDIKTDQSFERLKRFGPDLIVSIFFNQIIPERMLSLPSDGAFNLHPGPLPTYRGFSPVFWQLLHDRNQAGITLHRLTPELDEGHIVDEATCPIKQDDSYFSLYRRLAESGGSLLTETIENIRHNQPIPAHAQSGEAHHYSGFTREDLNKFYRKGNTIWRWQDFHSPPPIRNF